MKRTPETKKESLDLEKLAKEIIKELKISPCNLYQTKQDQGLSIKEIVFKFGEIIKKYEGYYELNKKEVMDLVGEIHTQVSNHPYFFKTLADKLLDSNY